MFTHRVLPLPSSLTTVTTPPDAQADRQDTLLRNSIILAHNSKMASVAYRDSTDIVNTRRASLRSSSPRRNRLPNSLAKESVDAYQTNSALLVGPSDHLTRKRVSSQDLIEEIQRSEHNLSSVSPSSNFASTPESASQVCLCQPDPKVPRPRNGKSPSKTKGFVNFMSSCFITKEESILVLLIFADLLLHSFYSI